MKVKLECVRTKAALETDCNALSHCTTATDDAVEELVKGERCWTDGRKQCTLNVFKQGTAGDCYSAVACTCNKECIQECQTDKFNTFEKCSSMKCMCDLKLEEVKKLQESYFSQPLALINEKADQDAFQAKLVDAQMKATPASTDPTDYKTKYEGLNNAQPTNYIEVDKVIDSVGEAAKDLYKEVKPKVKEVVDKVEPKVKETVKEAD